MKLRLLIEVLKALGHIEGMLHRIEAKMAKVDDQLAALTTAVQRTNTDVQGILDKLASGGNLSAEQSALLDQATSALGPLDDTLEGILGGSTGAGGGQPTGQAAGTQAGRQTP